MRTAPMQGKEILRLVNSLHRNKEIDEEVIFQAIESALQTAARKHFGTEEDIDVVINRETGEVAALKGERRVNPEMLGRIAAQTAKQIIVQKIREAESETIYNEFIERIGTLVTGSVQRFEGGAIIVNLEKTEAILPRSEQIPGEHYQAGERIRALLLDVRRANSLVKVLLSRTSPDFIVRLFELEVPEVAEGVVQIRKIAREPGLRSKVAVESLDPRVDCIGACVGVRGTRIKSIIDEIKGERIDIIPWSEAPEQLIVDSLRPAEILQITLEEGETTKRAVVVVPEDQLSLAIGWKGQNVRLAVKMSGWDIDIEPPEPIEEEAEEAEEGAEAEQALAAAQGEEPPGEREAEMAAEEPAEAEEATAVAEAGEPAGETEAEEGEEPHDAETAGEEAVEAEEEEEPAVEEAEAPVEEPDLVEAEADIAAEDSARDEEPEAAEPVAEEAAEVAQEQEPEQAEQEPEQAEQEPTAEGEPVAQEPAVIEVEPVVESPEAEQEAAEAIEEQDEEEAPGGARLEE
jgi:N utilization substance protein A